MEERDASEIKSRFEIESSQVFSGFDENNDLF
jgi:hypothetical protein